MNSRWSGSAIGRVLSGIMLIAMLGVGSLQAASLNLVPGTPNLVLFSGSLQYTGATGALSITGTTMDLDVNGSGFVPVAGGNFSLNAVLDGSGVFQSGTLVATGTTTDPGFPGATLLTANLTDFGFAGSGGAGIFEFTMDLTGGDMAAYGASGGVIASTFNLSPAAGGNWDSMLDFQQNFSATVNADAFAPVPVPAAVWLFGSALLGVIGFGRRQKQRI